MPGGPDILKFLLMLFKNMANNDNNLGFSTKNENTVKSLLDTHMYLNIKLKTLSNINFRSLVQLIMYDHQFFSINTLMHGQTVAG